MTEAEIRAILRDMLMRLKQESHTRCKEIEMLLESGQNDKAAERIRALRDKVEIETLRTENRILKGGE